MSEIDNMYEGLRSTSDDAEYQIYRSEYEGNVHIDIFKDFHWTKESLWELIDDLTEVACILEEDFNNTPEPIIEAGSIEDSSGLIKFVLDSGEFRFILGESENSEPKPVLVLQTGETITDEAADKLKEHGEKALKSANIDASVLVLSEGLHAYFLRVD